MKEIMLTQGKVALVDDEMFESLSRFKWTARKGHKTYYAYRVKRGTTEQEIMHRAIIGAAPNEVVDHINGDGLDNQRSNLRLATDAQNSQNRRKYSNGITPYKGVIWAKERKKWRAKIHVNGKVIYLGRFQSSQEAALAYDAAAKKYFGEFAHTNF